MLEMVCEDTRQLSSGWQVAVTSGPPVGSDVFLVDVVANMPVLPAPAPCRITVGEVARPLLDAFEKQVGALFGGVWRRMVGAPWFCFVF